MLSPCPDSPNCVSSSPGTDPDHYLEPLPYTGTLEDAKARLLAVLHTLPRTRIVKNDIDYLHAECTSFLFRFVDDLEFWFDTNNRAIHVRSASRVGYSDLGVNRKRVETIRTRFMNTTG